MSETDDLKYTYRFVTLTDQQLADLKETCAANHVRDRWNEKLNGYVASVVLEDETINSCLLRFLSKHDLHTVKHGVYISLVTDNDQGGFTAPDFVLNLLRESRGSLDVSFTVV